MTTMNISLSDSLKDFIDAQVDQRGFGTSSEYIREVIRKEQERLQLRDLLLAGAVLTVCARRSGHPNLARDGDAKAVVPRELAKRDADEAIDYYLSENAPEAALGFIDALERAYQS